MHFSFWEKNYYEQKVQVLILGGGITGVSTAISLKEKYPHISVAIVERSSFSAGASTKNAGFSCFGSPTEIWEDIDNMGLEKSMVIVQKRWRGLEMLKRRIPLGDMGYQNCGGFELLDREGWNNAELEDKLTVLNHHMQESIGLKHVYTIQQGSGFENFNHKIIYNPYEGSLDPVAMMNALHEKARRAGVIFRMGMEVQEIETVTKSVRIKGGLRLSYEILCVCTNGFAASFFPELNVTPVRNQVLMTMPLAKLPFYGCYHYDRGYFYFRHFENRILLGGGRNHDPDHETTDDFGNTPFIQQVLLEFLDKIVPGVNPEVDWWWSGILGVGTEKEPIIHWVDDYIICGVRLGGMGVALGSFLGEALSDNILVRLECKK